jgi:hypothetical protein
LATFGGRFPNYCEFRRRVPARARPRGNGAACATRGGYFGSPVLFRDRLDRYSSNQTSRCATAERKS